MDPEPPFEVTEIALGRVYLLPLRQLGPLRYLAALPLFVALAGGTFIVQFAARRAAGGPLDEWAWVTLALTTLGWARACYFLTSLAASMWNGRTEIRVGDDTSALATDRSGWFRVRLGKLKPGAARKLVLAELAAPGTGDTKPVVIGNGLWQLSAEIDGERKVWLAIGYPREVLAPLADDLAVRLALGPAPLVNPDTGEPLELAPLAPVPVVVEEATVPDRDVLEQPLDSRIGLERHQDGVTVTVPPPGVMRANCGLLVFGTIFAIVGTVLLATFVNQQINPPPPRPKGGDGPTWLGIVFLAVGIGFVLAAIHFGRKRVVLAVVGDQLLTFESGPLGSRRRSYIRAELVDIACGPSNVSSNNKALPQLQLVVVGGRAPVGMLTGRDEIELKWLATVLRQALGMPSEAPEQRKSANPADK